MGFSSQSGQVIFGTQPAMGTPVAFSDTVGLAMKLRSGSLAPNRELLVPDPEIGGGRDTADAYLGTVSFGGDYEFYARLESLPTLLKGVLGSASSATATGVNTHTITPSDAAALPFLSVQERISAGLEAYDYLDAVVNTLHLEAEANGYLQGTAGLIARVQTPQASPVDGPKWDNSPMIVGTNITLTYGGITFPAKSFSLDINNNFEDDDFRLGSFYIADLTPKSREITASVSIRHEDAAYFRQATYGTAAATSVGGLTTKAPLVITCTTYEDIVGSTPLTKSSLSITLPKVILEPFAFEPSGDDALENEIAMRAVRPNPGTNIATVVVKNGAATIA